MKMVYITTISQHNPVNGRVYEAFCEYDADLLEAHRIANEMAQIMGVNLSDLRYCISETSSPFGAILSYDEDNLSKDRIEDKRLQRVGSDLLFPMKDGKIEWHEFFDMDIESYEKFIFAGKDELLSDSEGDVF